MTSCVAWGRWCALLVGLMIVQPVFAAAPPPPSFTVTATNLTLSGQASGTSAFTLTSVQGYSDIAIVVKCTGPNPNLLPYVVLPECNVQAPITSLSAGGTTSGIINFFPPWTATQASSRHAWPLAGTLVAGIGLIGLRRWKRFRGHFAIVSGMLSLFLLTGLTGCIGSGGLAMTPGIYTFVISGTGRTTASTNITVTVKCNSCP